MSENEIITAEQVCELIKQTKGINSKPFDKDKKINFAYHYWNINSEDITDLYNSLAHINTSQTADMAKTIGEFLDHLNITYIHKLGVNFFNKDIDYIKGVTEKIKNNGNWLSQYNVEREFTKQSQSQFPILYKYIKQDGSIFTIDKNAATNILAIFTSQNVPTAKCIITSSFPYYANDNIDSYIKTLKKLK